MSAELPQEEKKRIFWIGLPKGWLKKPKILCLRSMKDGADFVLGYLQLLDESAPWGGYLTIDATTPYTAKTIAPVLGWGNDARKASRLIKALCDLKLLIIDEETGIWFFPEAVDLIKSKSESADRVARFRDRQKEEDENGKKDEKDPNVVTHTLQSNTDVTPMKHECNTSVPSGGSPKDESSSVSVTPTCTHTRTVTVPSEFPEGGNAADGSDWIDGIPFTDLNDRQQKTAMSIYRMYPIKAKKTNELLYAWVKRTNPTEEDVESMRSFLKKCLASDDWKKRLAECPDGRWLPTVIKFVRTWCGNRNITALMAETSPEDKAHFEAVRSEVDEFQKAREMSDEDLLAMEAEGKLKEGDCFSNELETRRNVGQIPQKGSAPRKDEPKKAGQSGGFKIPDGVLKRV